MIVCVTGFTLEWVLSQISIYSENFTRSLRLIKL